MGKMVYYFPATSVFKVRAGLTARQNEFLSAANTFVRKAVSPLTATQPPQFQTREYLVVEVTEASESVLALLIGCALIGLEGSDLQGAPICMHRLAAGAISCESTVRQRVHHGGHLGRPVRAALRVWRCVF